MLQISEELLSALKMLCAMQGGKDHPWYPIKGICDVLAARLLRNMGFVRLEYFGDTDYNMQAHDSARAYVELLKVIEILRAKVDALQVPEEKQRSDEVDGSEKHFVHLLRKGRNRP